MAQQSPNILALQQQRMLQQQQQRQQVMAAQQMYAQQNGLPVNVPMSQQQINQFNAMRNGAMRQIPPHIQQAHLAQQGQHQNPQAMQQVQVSTNSAT